ncbi:MAG TPA: DUF6782 family putative metallopeptidase [Patescibacteria group bacterium]|nr:DUF6782 family putative metallopeptidase [Patescibacteria group bacterium]
MALFKGKLKEKFEQAKWRFAPKRMRRTKLDQAIAMISQYPETKFLLDLAHQEGVGVAFDKAMAQGPAAARLVTNRETGQQYIALNPYAEPTDLALSLIHELRHVWQDKVLHLSPQTRGLSEPDSETALMLTRVREADAHAFVNLMVRRIQHAKEDEAELKTLAGQLQNGTGAPIDELQAEVLSKYMARKFQERLDGDGKQMQQDFLWALQNLDPYDRQSLVDYHVRYTTPQQDPMQHERGVKPFDVAQMRKILHIGVAEEAPAYLDHLTDPEFKTIVMSDVAPELKSTVSLMNHFENSAKRGAVTPRDSFGFRAAIEERLAKAVNQPPRPTSPSLYG